MHKTTINHMNKYRISYIDFGAGIMILWMILGHAFSSSWGMQLFGLWDVTDISLLPQGPHYYINKEGKVAFHSLWAICPYLHFFMPWFFYKSGQFFSKRSIADEWKKDWNKLIRQFLIWGFLGYLLYIGFSYFEGEFTLRQLAYRPLRVFFLEGFIPLNTPIWFLFTLFGVRQIANIVLPKQDSKLFWLQCIAIILFGYLVSYAAYRLDPRLLPQWVANGAAGLAFFTMGYSLHKYETKLWLIIPCFVGFLACCIWGFPVVGMKSNTLETGIYLLNMPACLSGIVLFNVLSRLIAKYLPMVSRPFEYVGIYAMIIYVSHGLLYISITKILSDFELTSLMPYSLWLILGAYIIFLPILCVLKNRFSRMK